MWIHLLLGAGLGASAGAAPGALQAYLLNQTTQHGWRRALPAVFAPLVSDIPIILVVVFLLTRFPPGLLRGLHIVGGCFLLYLAAQSYRAARHKSALPSVDGAHAPQTFFKAVLANGLNAGPYIFWSVIAGPQLLKIWAESPEAAVGFLMAFHVVLVGTYAVQVFFFAAVRRMSAQSAPLLNLIAALALLLMGLYQIYGGVVSG